MTTTETTAAVHVLRGNGNKVHLATYFDNRGRPVYTRCAQDVLFASTQDLALRVVDHAVTCLTCLGEVAAAQVETDIEVPACCPMHPTTEHTFIEVKTIKRGTKSTYACGAIFWHGKGWDPRNSH